MSAIAVVPVKLFSEAKHRLSPSCSREERQTLSQAFLWDLLEKLCACESFAHICVISQEPQMQTWINRRTLPVSVLSDPGDQSLNDAFTIAVNHFSPLYHTMVFVHGDLPLVETSDFACLIDKLEQVEVVLAADRRQRGTNAIAMRLPTQLSPCFGENSIDKYQRICRSQHISYSLMCHKRFGFDVDYPQDVEELSKYIASAAAPRTQQALSASLQ